MELIDLLSLDASDPSNVSAIFSSTLELLEEIRESDFENKKIHKLTGVMAKFNDMVKSFSESNAEDVSQVSKDLVTLVIKNSAAIPRLRVENCLSRFALLHDLVVSEYNQVIKVLYSGNKFSDFLLLYNPDLSNKCKAIDLINEAVKLVDSDKFLNNSQKRQIKNALFKALDNLYKEKTDWTSYFGTMQQTITILGALGSLAGGVTGVIALKQANEKLIEANNIVVQSSIQNCHVVKSIELNQTYAYLPESSGITQLTQLPRLILPSSKLSNDE